MLEPRSVVPEWMLSLPMQQQSVILLAARGPDGIAKDHPVKDIQRAYRGTVLSAAYHGRMLEFGEHADSFMSLDYFSSPQLWRITIGQFLHTIDTLPHHYIMHILYGSEILGYKHPDPRFRVPWQLFYRQTVHELHLNPESEEEMDRRLNDWGQEHWGS